MCLGVGQDHVGAEEDARGEALGGGRAREEAAQQGLHTSRPQRRARRQLGCQPGAGVYFYSFQF